MVTTIVYECTHYSYKQTLLWLYWCIKHKIHKDVIRNILTIDHKKIEGFKQVWGFDEYCNKLDMLFIPEGYCYDFNLRYSNMEIEFDRNSIEKAERFLNERILCSGPLVYPNEVSIIIDGKKMFLGNNIKELLKHGVITEFIKRRVFPTKFK